MVRISFAFILLASSAVADAAQDARQRFFGPLRFCGRNMMMNLQKGEQLIYWAGPDFEIYNVRSVQGRFSVYEGFAPDDAAASRTEATLSEGRKAIKLEAGITRVSYLFKVARDYVHLFGPAWTGDGTDGALLARVRTGSAKAIGCAKPSFDRQASIEAQMTRQHPS